MKSRVLVILVAGCAMLAACVGSRHDSRLDTVATIVSDRPEEAMLRLDSIGYPGLSEPDRHLYDLLSIKAADKAYIRHTSDSLILDVIDWYGSHRETGLYPEALYYGGRVYSDLGDYPTSLHYFQQALDELPEDAGNQKLRATVLSQTGRLLNLLRLYKEAESYIDNTIKLNRILDDSVNEINNLQLLGSTQLRAGRYNDAERAFNQALGKSDYLPESLRINSTMYLGAIKFYRGETDSALMLIRNIPETIDSLGKNSAYAYASQIYLQAGIFDTAYYYAHKLINSNMDLNKQSGYHVLLSPGLRKIVNPDSLFKYARDYSMLVEKRYDENENQLALNQQAFYNYQLHERERKKAEQSKGNLYKALIYTSVFIILLILLVLYLKYRNSIQLLRLNEALNGIQTLRRELDDSRDASKVASNGMSREAGTDLMNGGSDVNKGLISRKPEELRERLREELMELYESSERQPVSPVILNSDVYATLMRMIESGQPLNDDDPVWKELEKTVLESSSNFMSNLRLLTFGNLTQIDIKTALLLKCGLKPKQLSTLLVKSNGAIISRREMLSIKIFGKKVGVAVIDGIIRLL